jgi:hypothetical protein
MEKGGNSASFTLAEISNVFVKPDEQWKLVLIAMARKGRMKSNVFVKPDEQWKLVLIAMARKGRMKSKKFHFG